MKPVLFDTDMVRGILGNLKTATRRVVKEPYYIDEDVLAAGSGLAIHRGTRMTDGFPYPDQPYSRGDILYVRETFNSIRFGNGVKVPFRTEYWYKADDTSQNPDEKWRPSIHMPREAARIFLRVTAVRVMKLQEMEIPDFKAEGIIPRRPNDLPGHGCDCAWKTDTCLSEPCRNRDAYEYLCFSDPFMEIWNRLYAKPRPVKDRNGLVDHYESYPWEDICETRTYRGKPWYVIGNPWVWVIEFERISKEEAERA